MGWNNGGWGDGSVTNPQHGGTGITSYTTGDVLYASGATTLAKRAIGAAGQVLTVTGGVPTWETNGSGSGTVTDVSVTTANGVSGVVATSTTTPAITLTLGVITPTSVQTTGNSGITTAPTANAGLRVSPTASTGTTQYGVVSSITSASDATSETTSFLCSAATAAAAYTSTDVHGILIGSTTKGAGSTITNNYGLNIRDQNVAGATNYAIYTGAGDVRLGGAVTCSSTVNVTGKLSASEIAMTGMFSVDGPQTIASAVMESTALTKSYIHVTGATNFSRMETTGLTAGTIVYLRFMSPGGTLDIPEDSAPSGTAYGFKLVGNVNWSNITANSTLMVILDTVAQRWMQISRMVY